jgi:hypothetical protein
MESEISAIEEETGEKVDKNKLLKYTLDNELVDTKGNWNYRVAHRLMKAEKEEKKTVSEDRKNLADATTSDKKAPPAKPDYSTSDTFNNPMNRPW